MSDDLEKRMKIMHDVANQLFNRLESNISYLGNKISTFFGILIGLISFQIVFLRILLNNNCEFSNYSWILLILFSIFIILSIIFSIYLLRPSEYKDIDIFKKKRFIRLSSCDKKTLLSDFIFHLKVCYEHNYEIYNKNVYWLYYLYASFILANLFYIGVIISISI